VLPIFPLPMSPMVVTGLQAMQPRSYSRRRPLSF
jgi:hypothetical protein